MWNILKRLINRKICREERREKFIRKNVLSDVLSFLNSRERCPSRMPRRSHKDMYRIRETRYLDKGGEEMTAIYKVMLQEIRDMSNDEFDAFVARHFEKKTVYKDADVWVCKPRIKY